MRALPFAVVVPLTAGLLAFGCSSQPDVTSSANAVVTTGNDAADLADARAAVAVLSGSNAHCTACHTAGHDDIVRWGTAMKAMDDKCLSSSLTLSANDRIACVHGDGTDDPGFSPSTLGLYAAAAALPDFSALFQAAYPADQWQAKYDAFKTAAGMPENDQPGLTEDQFTSLKGWVLRGMPKLDDVVVETDATQCVPNQTPALLDHIADMAANGWGARLADADTPMSNCSAGVDSAGCLTSFDDVTSDWNAAGAQQTLRMVSRLAFHTSYWVRSSADGRFTSFGGSPARIIDHTAPDSTAPITADAPYDPGYFPNNDGFSFASTGAGGITVCKQSVLIAAANSTARHITFTEPGCTHIIDTVYQSVGAALDGSLYFMATGTHTNDAGGLNGPLSASFGATATTTLTPMFNDGTKYNPGANVDVVIPYEGDQQMSASNTLLLTRFGQKAGYAGYHLRRVTPTFTPSTDPSQPLPAVSVALQDLGTVCIQGGKPQLSFNERFLAVHQYVDPNANPQSLPLGTSNIFVVDLKTGKPYQATTMKAGQHALYPHWRADGWLYFIVKDSNTNKEMLVGSDVAIQAAAAAP